MSDAIDTQKSLTGFMRAEVKRMKEQNQGGGRDYNSQDAIISEDAEINHGGGGYEEYESGGGAAGGTAVNGMPARIPTEMMDVPATESTNPTDEVIAAAPTDDQEYEYYDEEVPAAAATTDDQTEQAPSAELAEPAKSEEIGTGMTAEFAALDEEMAEQFYYINKDGMKCGPFSMEEVTQKYKEKEISDDTQIWDGTQTKESATALKENKRIYSNLPRPPKRQQPAAKQPEPETKQPEPVKAEPAKVVQQGKTPNVSDSKPPPNNAQNGGGCCIVL